MPEDVFTPPSPDERVEQPFTPPPPESRVETTRKPLSIGQAVLGARSGMQSESLEAREFLRTAPGQVRGTGDQPVIPIPRIPQQRSVLGQLGAGTVNIGSALAEMTETPNSIAAAPVLPARLTQLLFGGQALSDIRSAYEEARQPGTTIQQGLELGGRALVDALFGVGMVRGAVGDRLAPRTAAEVRTSAAGLERITPDRGGEINAIKTRQIQKGIQPERAGTPQGANVPAYDAQVREGGGEQAGRGDSLRAAAEKQAPLIEGYPGNRPTKPPGITDQEWTQYKINETYDLPDSAQHSQMAEVEAKVRSARAAAQAQEVRPPPDILPGKTEAAREVQRIVEAQANALADIHGSENFPRPGQRGEPPLEGFTQEVAPVPQPEQPVSEAGQAPAVSGQPKIISTAINTPEGIKRGIKWNQPHDEIGQGITPAAETPTTMGEVTPRGQATVPTWREIPSVTPGGKKSFFVADTAEGKRWVVWDRFKQTWTVQGEQQIPSPENPQGRAPILAEVKSAAEGKKWVESRQAASVETARPSPTQEGGATTGFEDFRTFGREPTIGVSAERVTELASPEMNKGLTLSNSAAVIRHFDKLTPEEQQSVLSAQQSHLEEARARTKQEYAKGRESVKRLKGTDFEGRGMEDHKAALRLQKSLEATVERLKSQAKPVTETDIPKTEVELPTGTFTKSTGQWRRRLANGNAGALVKNKTLISQLEEASKVPPVPKGETRAIGGAAAQQGISEEQKGFIIREPDGTERFTNDRTEAAGIAKAAGQVKPENAGTTELHSRQLQEAPETAAAVPPTTERLVPQKVSPEVFNTAVNALRSMKESKGTATERVNAAIRDLSQAGEEVNLNNVLRRALQRNVPQVIEVGSPREIGVSELEGRAMGAAGTAEIPIRGWKDMIDAGEQPALHPTAERAATQFIGKVLDTVGRGFRNTRDFLTVEPVPKMTRVGLADAAYEHASARNSVVHSVRHLLSRVFPDEYKNPELMRKTGDILTKDNILGVYDQAKARFEATRNAQAPTDVAEHNATGKAMKAIEAAHDLAAYDKDVQAARADPKISANIDRWKQWVNPEMDRMYNEIKGYDPWTIQESRGRHFEARINLLPKDQGAQIGAFTDTTKSMPEMPTSNYRNPNVKRDPFMRQAKGTGQYETDPGLILTNSIARRWNEITKIRLYEAVQKTGNGFITEPGERPPMTEIDGEPLARMAVKMPETTEKGLTRSVEKSLWIKKSLVRETRDVLNTDLAAPSNPVFRALTQLQLLQAVDMTAHMKNIHTVVANSLGASRGWVDAVRKIPVLATADTVGRIAAVTKEVLADTPAIRDEISQMARQGMIRPAYPPSGIQKITRGQQMIHSVDTASRIVMNRFWDNLAERGMVNDTMQARRAFVNQIGEYNRRLMGHFSRNMRDYGLSPFVVAGRTFNRFSKRLLLGDPGFKAATPQAALAARAYQLGGLTLAVTLPAIVNYITTGHFGGRPGTPIGAIDTGTNNAKGDKRIIDILQLMGIRRGLRGTGVGAIIEGVREGKSVNEIGGKMIEDITSTASHPWIGPGLGAVYSGLTGKRLDLRGGSWPYIAKQKKEGGLEQYKENFRVTLKNQNPLIYGLIAPLIGETDDTYMQGLGRGFLKAPVSALGVQEKPGSSAFSTKRERTKNREAAPRPRQTKQ